MDRLISLSVGVQGPEDYFRTFQDISELARNLGDSHNYVAVSASVCGDDVLEADPVIEELHVDEFTLVKVHQALMDAGTPYGLGEQQISDMIISMQNAGILFRERAK